MPAWVNRWLKLASSPMNNIVPLETATIVSGQTSASFNHLFTQAGTYYVKVTNGLLFDINYTLTSTFVAYHYHSFNGGPVVPIDAVYHGSQCICGEIGNIMQHTVKPKNPNYCIICGGAALLPNNLQPVTNQFVKPVGLDSFTNEDGVVLIGDLDLNILLLDSSYDEYLHNF